MPNAKRFLAGRQKLRPGRSRSPSFMNSPAVNEMQLEYSVYTLFAEFLAGFFDGGVHAVGGNAAVQFTKAAAFKFGQAALPQPLDGVGISMMLMQGATRKPWETVIVNGISQRQQMAYSRCRFNFYVRSEAKTTTAGNAKSQAAKTADLLKGLLDNAGAVQPLGQKGILRMRPGIVEPIAETAFALLYLPVMATLRYPVLSQTFETEDYQPATPYQSGNCYQMTINI